MKSTSFPEILDYTASLFIKVEDFDSIPAVKKYIYFYCEAANRFLKSFEISRSRCIDIVSSNQEKPEDVKEIFNTERQCWLALEQAYNYLHRIELLIRNKRVFNGGLVDKEPFYRVEFAEQMTTTKNEEWLNDFYYISSIRNKVLEHAPENLSFYSNWKNNIDPDDPYNFRLWILHEEVSELINSEGPIKQEIDKALEIIGNHISIERNKWDDTFLILNNGARYLSITEQHSLFKNALTKVGCISHEPIELAAKLSNCFKFIFKV